VPSLAPPEKEVDVSMSDQGRQSKPRQDPVPYLATEDTSEEDMIHCLRGLEAHDAIVIDLQPMSLLPLRGPATMAQSQLEKELDLGWCTSLLDQLCIERQGQFDKHRTGS
jgi:hypothetical protein